MSVRLDDKNYSYWSYVMRNFLKGKKMWGYVSGTSVKPKNTDEGYDALIDAWEANNAKIITWINNSVEHSIDLWDQLALIESEELKACGAYIVRREQQRLVQFLTALRSDFEGLRGSILHRSPLLSIDSIVSELLAEEIRLKSHSEKGIFSTSNPSVLAIPSKPVFNNQNKPYTRVAFDECSFCKQKGLWKGYKPPQSNTATVVSSGPFTNPSTLAEQFQKFLSLQPQAMSASSSVGQFPHSSSGMSHSVWVLDAGASHHMSPDFSSFASVSPSSSIPVMTADSTHMPLAGDLQSRKLIGTGRRNGGLHILDELKVPVAVAAAASANAVATSVDLSSFHLSPSSSGFYLWHSRLGYVSSSRLRFLASTDGNVHQTSCTDTPEQNGVAERKHRHIVETARSLLLSASIPSVFWGEAILIAVGLINTIPSSHISGFSPFEKLYGYAPDYSFLKVFGCTCFILRPHVERSKLSSRSAICVFLGYGEGVDILLSGTPEGPSSPVVPQAPSKTMDPPLRQSIRIRKSTKLPDFAYSCYSSSFASLLASIHCLSEPSSYKEAILVPLWQQAMDEELSALHKTGTWDLVPLPLGKTVVGCRWVYKIKTNSDGSIERYKARLVAKGYSQQYRIDYEETFALVAKMITIRTLIAVASVRQWHIS
ncbi:uncharacterized protein LOC116115383 [Pistacia vera]|uniref:uncharacterized protein LOC116115383 n=1 Tax=Pistacia vera TaxID=55513 RepID=UPI00126376D8|nr:uncharacterized protein LOC116115383 [Pistacia vera]